MSHLFQDSSAGFTLRVVLTALALVQIYAYVFVVFFTLFVGEIDILLPVRFAFGATTVSVIVLSAGDVNTARKNRGMDFGQLGLSVYRFAVELATLAGLFVIAFLFLIKPLSSVNLSSELTLDVKIVVVVGLISLLSFTALAVADLLALRRKGGVPHVALVAGGLGGALVGKVETGAK